MGLLKYPGGKEKELDVILQHAPTHFKRYFEPFVGGGAVYQAIDATQYFINDLSTQLVWFYQSIKEQNPEFISLINKMESDWRILDDLVDKDIFIDTYKSYIKNDITEKEFENYISKTIVNNADLFNNLGVHSDYGFKPIVGKVVFDKCKRLYKLEHKQHLPEEDIEKNLVGAFKAAYYTYIRDVYNNMADKSPSFQAAIYLFIRELCYSCMFRFSSSGDFNVPYGGISYNSRSFSTKLDLYESILLQEKMKDTTVCNMDYEKFLSQFDLCDTDFIFLDPPYDSAFSTYDTNVFDMTEQKRLADYLINKCKGKFMLVTKNTEFIKSLYEDGVVCANGNKLKVSSYDKNYFVSFMNRNAEDKKVKHLMICNY
jgi:DNA adenine methylase